MGAMDAKVDTTDYWTNPQSDRYSGRSVVPSSQVVSVDGNPNTDSPLVGMSNSGPRIPKRYLRPGALAQLRDAAIRKRARVEQNTRGNKRFKYDEAALVLRRESAQSPGREQPNRTNPVYALQHYCTPINGQRKKLFAPRVPQPVGRDEGDQSPPLSEIGTPEIGSPEIGTPEVGTPEIERSPVAQGSETTFDCLPFEMLIRIVCHLSHSDLQIPFFVCKRLREATSVARLLHFNYSTPDHHHHRQESHLMGRQSSQQTIYQCSAEAAASAATAAEVAGSGHMATPSAPKQPPRPMVSRVGVPLHRRIAAPLFQTTPNKANQTPRQASGRGNLLPPGLPRPAPLVAPHRALFHADQEEEVSACKTQS